MGCNGECGCGGTCGGRGSCGCSGPRTIVDPDSGNRFLAGSTPVTGARGEVRLNKVEHRGLMMIPEPITADTEVTEAMVSAGSVRDVPVMPSTEGPLPIPEPVVAGGPFGDNAGALSAFGRHFDLGGIVRISQSRDGAVTPHGSCPCETYASFVQQQIDFIQNEYPEYLEDVGAYNRSVTHCHTLMEQWEHCMISTYQIDPESDAWNRCKPLRCPYYRLPNPPPVAYRIAEPPKPLPRNPDIIWDDVIYGALPLCRAYGEMIDWIADQSVTDLDFRRRLHESIGWGNNLARAWGGVGGTEFNEASKANWDGNYRHFASALYYGSMIAVVYGLYWDSAETTFQGPEEEAENAGEVYADFMSAIARQVMLSCGREAAVDAEGRKTSPVERWAKCRHVPGNLWRSIFCVEWG